MILRHISINTNTYLLNIDVLNRNIENRKCVKLISSNLDCQSDPSNIVEYI